MSAVDFLFWVFAVLTVGGGVCMIFSRHPISAAMFMIVSLVGVAALFVLLESFFLAVLQVLVYAGGSDGFIFVYHYAARCWPGCGQEKDFQLEVWDCRYLLFHSAYCGPYSFPALE